MIVQNDCKINQYIYLFKYAFNLTVTNTCLKYNVE